LNCLYCSSIAVSSSGSLPFFLRLRYTPSSMYTRPILANGRYQNCLILYNHLTYYRTATAQLCIRAAFASVSVWQASYNLLTYSVFCTNTSRQILGQYQKIINDRFHTHPCQFTINNRFIPSL
jgi:hypothetical protein